MSSRPLVVGFGPAGMFASLLLAENGYRPLVIERGDSPDERLSAVKEFCAKGILDENSNFSFGAGGAGTFSDGKLVTRSSDILVRYFLRRMVEFGAPPGILTEAKPHVGTDMLIAVVKAIEKRVVSCGGEVRFRTRFLDIDDSSGRVLTDCGPFSCGALILAIGNAASDTALRLLSHLPSEAKPLSFGFRMEHLQSDIEGALYGKFAGDIRLPRASYSLSHRVDKKIVYTFCMCPGGYVIPTSTVYGQLSINGMSDYGRGGRNANSAVLVTVSPADFSNDVCRIISFRDEAEKKAFSAGGGGFALPYTTMAHFLDPSVPFRQGKVIPSYPDGLPRTPSDLSILYPEKMISELRAGLKAFAKTMPVIGDPESILCGSETRASSPWRFIRDRETMQSVGPDWIYPCGEGSGYSGGITTSAIDGIRAALAMMKRFQKPVTDRKGILS